jgi:oxygen-independent coproporphyrinogen-3 oxidase
MPSTLGAYVHIPFCESKCDYCNFASGVYPQKIVAPYLECLRKDISSLHVIAGQLNFPPDRFSALVVDSVYLGGGTPSMIAGRSVGEVLGLLRQVFHFAPDTEITLEVNPGSADANKIEAYLEAGVNRISIGMQAFQEELLQRIGRSHTVQDSINTFELFRKMGLTNISLDLIAGLPGQTLKEWRQNLRMIDFLNPEHVSMYLLEIHESTRFGKIYGSYPSSEVRVFEGQQFAELPSEELLEAFYFEAIDHVQKSGYRQYEISNFAIPGYESRHNLKYWTGKPFVGFGCSAHSYLDGRRWGNERSVGRYMELIQSQSHAIVFQSNLTTREREEEAIFLGLRLAQGLDLMEFKNNFGFDLKDRYEERIHYLQEGELVGFSPERLWLTPRGFILSNEVFSELLSGRFDQ